MSVLVAAVTFVSVLIMKKGKCRCVSRKVTGQSLLGMTMARLCLLGVFFGAGLFQLAYAFSPGAVTCQSGINFNGNNITVDSYDSADPLHSYWPGYPDGRGYGLYTNTGTTHNLIRKANGNLAAASSIINIGILTGYGDIEMGPGGSVANASLSSVGSVSWVDAGTAGIQPGYFTNDLNLVLADVQLPNTNWTSFSDSTISNSGYYAMSQITANMSISGGTNKINVVLYLTNGISFGGGKTFNIGTNASITIYAGGSINLGGAGVINNTSQHASQFKVYGLSTLTSIHLTGNGPFHGTIYAPYADVSIRGSGASGGFNGALVCKSVICIGTTTFSYDEALASTLSDLLAPTILSASYNAVSGAFALKLEGVQGFNYAIQTSSNLTDWVSVTTNTSPFNFTNSNPVADSQRFYRSVYIP